MHYIYHKGRKEETDIEEYKLGHKTAGTDKGTKKTMWSAKRSGQKGDSKSKFGKKENVKK